MVTVLISKTQMVTSSQETLFLIIICMGSSSINLIPTISVGTGLKITVKQ